MSAKANTKTVVRLLMAWGDEKEQRWLEEQEHSGWHLKTVRCFGYTLERAAPAALAYRLDFGPPRFADRSEYFGLFRDAGWEHVGTRGLWQYFRKAVTDGQIPEIHTDPRSRIAGYRRVIAILLALLAVMVTQAAPRLIGDAPPGSALGWRGAVLGIQLALALLFTYGIVKLLLVISSLRRSGSRELGTRH